MPIIVPFVTLLTLAAIALSLYPKGGFRLNFSEMLLRNEFQSSRRFFRFETLERKTGVRPDLLLMVISKLLQNGDIEVLTNKRNDHVLYRFV